ncbi:hypothetical protein HDU98_000136 [Podochytrium sp. JEL0797]|nr:hypothetical protein HDU98_000136 [Podochytrium sp. JEL0797]
MESVWVLDVCETAEGAFEPIWERVEVVEGVVGGGSSVVGAAEHGVIDGCACEIDCDASIAKMEVCGGDVGVVGAVASAAEGVKLIGDAIGSEVTVEEEKAQAVLLFGGMDLKSPVSQPPSEPQQFHAPIQTSDTDLLHSLALATQMASAAADLPAASTSSGISTPVSNEGAALVGADTASVGSVELGAGEEVDASHQIPFKPSVQKCHLYNSDKTKAFNMEIQPSIDRGFFIAQGEWTCYRRNYFQLSSSITITESPTTTTPAPPAPTSPETLRPLLPSTPVFNPATETYHIEINNTLHPITTFLTHISAKTSDPVPTPIELVQHTSKRDKGPLTQPVPRVSECTPDTRTVFERIQFRTATLNNGRRKLHTPGHVHAHVMGVPQIVLPQQYFLVNVEVLCKVATGEFYRVCACEMEKGVVVRGRAPGHYVARDLAEAEGVGGEKVGVTGEGEVVVVSVGTGRVVRKAAMRGVGVEREETSPVREMVGVRGGGEGGGGVGMQEVGVGYQQGGSMQAGQQQQQQQGYPSYQQAGGLPPPPSQQQQQLPRINDVYRDFGGFAQPQQLQQQQQQSSFQPSFTPQRLPPPSFNNKNNTYGSMTMQRPDMYTRGRVDGQPQQGVLPPQQQRPIAAMDMFGQQSSQSMPRQQQFQPQYQTLPPQLQPQQQQQQGMYSQQSMYNMPPQNQYATNQFPGYMQQPQPSSGFISSQQQPRQQGYPPNSQPQQPPPFNPYQPQSQLSTFPPRLQQAPFTSQQQQQQTYPQQRYPPQQQQQPYPTAPNPYAPQYAQQPYGAPMHTSNQPYPPQQQQQLPGISTFSPYTQYPAHPRPPAPPKQKRPLRGASADSEESDYVVEEDDESDEDFRPGQGNKKGKGGKGGAGGRGGRKKRW